MRIRPLKILTAIEYISLAFLILFLSFLYAFSANFNLKNRFIVKKDSYYEDANLGYCDEFFLKFLGSAQNGAIEPFIGSKADFLFKIAKTKDLKITLIPGETTEVFLNNLSNEYNLSIKTLKQAYYSKTDIPDGVLFPETYFIKQDGNESYIIDRLYSESIKEHKKLSNELLGSFDSFFWFGVVVPKASIIQKEAITKEEMPLISSVIDNRMRLNMPLQMDGSLNYGIYSHQKITPARIRDDRSVYNTYKRLGVPPYPVCSVSKDAIIAALRPAKTDYLYFMRNSSGVHTFTKTYNEHIKVIQSVQNRNTVR